MSPDADAAAAAATPAGGGSGTTTTLPTPSPVAAGGGRAVIQWDDILPRRSLRVLLVEHDDSTRQVVTALLRKCGYHVAAVADGMKAWKVMRERAYAFDLVLTEVVMPSLSGIDLLSRIVAAEECKNIPVIMMSSQDSIGVVLKCMLKGAVDFLVKPVRKNELRNLWQHVWRRHSMNSQTNASENNAASNHISANAGNGSKVRENSYEESDAQSSGSKKETEVQSAQKLQQIATDDGAGSSREHGEKQNGALRVTTKAHASNSSDDAPSGNACDINRQQMYSTKKNAHPKHLDGTTSVNVSGQLMDNALRIADTSSCRPSDPNNNQLTLNQPAADQKCKSSVMENNAVGENTPGEDSNGAEIGRAESCPSHFLETNIGKQWLNGYANREFREKDIFSHSSSSAFSRYGDKRIQSSAQQQFCPALCIHEESVYDEKDAAVQPNVLPSHQHNKGKSTMQVQVSLDSNKEVAAMLCSSSVREDVGTSSTSPRKDSLSLPSFGFVPVPIPIGAAIPYQNICAGYGAILQPMYYPQTSFMHCGSAAIEKTAIQRGSCQSNDHENCSKPLQFAEHKQLEENQQLHHSRQIHRQLGESFDSARIPVEQVNHGASYSQDVRIGSGSGETDANTNMIIALESGYESGVQNCRNKGLDSDRSRREAALLKFRMKRKDRCFEKKVRYHSRKKLAEQRPRVKGQFVSHKLKSATTIDSATD